MEKIDLVLWFMGAGFSLMFTLMLLMWNSLTSRIEGVEKNLGNRIDTVEKNLSNRIDKLDEKVTDIDRRLCRLEGAFSSKDCCMIKDSSQMRKAE